MADGKARTPDDEQQGAVRPQGDSPGRSGRRRLPWGSLSRQRVVDAALAIVESGGYEEMTIRSLAAELGVAPMSLYRHVKDKDDLLDEVVDRLLGSSWRPAVDEEDWRAWVAEAADRLRMLLVAHPAALQAFLRHPVVSPVAIERMEAMLAVLGSTGADEEEAWRAYATIHTYTVGFAALEASRARWAPRSGEDRLTGQLASLATPHQFGDGLGWLLDAFERGANHASTSETAKTRDARASSSREQGGAGPTGVPGGDVAEDLEAHRFVTTGAEPPSELVYHEEPGRLVLVHTGVPPERRGKGEASRLVAAAVERAASDELAVVPVCSYVRRWLEAHPKEAAVVRIEWP